MAEVGARMEGLDGDAAVRGCHIRSTAAKEATLTPASHVHRVTPRQAYIFYTNLVTTK